MSVIIKGMDMPTNCADCQLSVNAYDEVTGESMRMCLARSKSYPKTIHRRLDCPLIEIPTPHGRLIDEDEITFHKHLEATGNGQYDEILVVYERDIDLAPTILEAEE